MQLTPDDFPEFTQADAPIQGLLIPAPAHNGNLRPNPQPIKPVNIAAKVTHDRKAELLTPDTLIKKVNLHPLDEADEAKLSDEVQMSVTAKETAKTEEAKQTEKSQQPSASDASEFGSQPHAPKTKCFAFMGASGGIGVTTFSVQLAFEMAEQVKASRDIGQRIDPQVCLIDLDFETGACASYLDVPPSLHIEDICGAPERIDTSIVQALISYHESGVAVLSTSNTLGANSLANPETVLAILDAACELYQYVIIDLPRIWQPWIGAAIAGADHFAILSELTIPSLHMTRSRIANIETVLGDQVNCEVILNKVERRSFRNSIRLSDAEKALGRPVSASICVDYDTTREAINCGEAVSVIRPEARYVKDVKSLVKKWGFGARKQQGLRKERRRKRRAA